ncbi:uncharacterized protein MCYG_01202 [Microsporum canis CBS 113480]|uniref:Uncharacterized protein n=1 Tax=Arthroderma otae (strain ATCC MYA-4605 / CBS 113480) TaxID=554155 RepID=C5FF20_ARTOC|nr:uncharacterized protein MCYG_01202 [Microsporum canis CBS 113480]EEQ28314.1 predicted protein [Microsporum canis CBS 113480]
MEKLFDVFMMTFVALFLTVPFVSIFIILVWPELEKALDAAVVRWIVKIRKVKGIFDAKESRRQQEERIRLMRNIDHDIRVLKQRDIFLRAMVLEFAAEGKVEEIEGLDFIGPKNWRKKLADSKERLRTHEGYCESLFYTAPEWPKICVRAEVAVQEVADAAGGPGPRHSSDSARGELFFMSAV